ncbi:MAG: RsmE family RNA methyltransferase [Bacilli bacterium]
MQQYFAKSKTKDTIELEQKDLYHIFKVMRLKTGDNIRVCFENTMYLCSIIDENNNVKIESIIGEEKEKPKIVIYVPVVSDEKMSLIITKCIELGATEFIPIELSHCKYKLKEEDKKKKQVRWQRIAKESSEQSYRYSIPQVKDIISIDNLSLDTNVNLLCSLDKEDVKPLSKVLTSSTVTDTISLLFGPEGGLTITEEEKLSNIGFIKVSLGKNVFRCETVPIYIVSVISYLRGEVKC